MTQPEKVKYIIDKSVEYFGITKERLLNDHGSRSGNQRIKRYIALILSEETELTQQAIAEEISVSNKDCVCVMLKKIREELSDDFYGINKTKVVYRDLLKHIAG